MNYSQSTQQDVKKVLANTTAINEFRKAFYEDKTEALPVFSDIYYIIEQQSVESGHPFYRIKEDEKVSWELFTTDVEHFTKSSKAFYKRLGLLNDSLIRRAGEAYIKAVLPTLKSESQKLAVQAASLLNRTNYYKKLLTEKGKAVQDAINKTI